MENQESKEPQIKSRNVKLKFRSSMKEC